MSVFTSIQSFLLLSTVYLTINVHNSVGTTDDAVTSDHTTFSVDADSSDVEVGENDKVTYGFELFDGTENNNKTLQEFLAKVSDGSIRRLVYEQVRHCPYIGTCQFDLGLQEHLNIKFCCSQCSCDSYCHTIGTCCPDAPPNHPMTTAKNADSVCLNTSLPLQTMRAGVFGKAYCPRTTPTEIRQQCERAQVPSTMLEVYENSLVTDRLTNVTYKNRHCARCNGVEEENMVIWSPTFSCMAGESNVFLRNFNNISPLTLIETTKRCYINYQSEHVETRECNPKYIESTCNTTGRWKTREPWIEEGCSMYISPVETEDKTLYKNVFCALCNGYRGIKNICGSGNVDNVKEPWMIDFKAFFDFRVHSQPPSTCPLGQLKSQAGCIEAYCPLMRQKVGDKCLPSITHFDGLNYKISFRIFLEPNVTLFEGYKLADATIDWMKERVSELKSADNVVQFFGYELFLQSRKDSLNGQLMDDSKIHFCDLTLICRFNGKHNPEELWRSLMSRNGKRECINSDFCFRSVLFDNPGNMTYTANKYLYPLNESTAVCERVGHYHNYGKVIYTLSKESAWFDVSTGHFIMPLVSIFNCDRWPTMYQLDDVSILHYNDCPLIEISFTEMPWIETVHGISFKGTNASLQSYEFVYGGIKRDTISVCIDRYFKLNNTVRNFSEPMVNKLVWLKSVFLFVLTYKLTLSDD